MVVAVAVADSEGEAELPGSGGGEQSWHEGRERGSWEERDREKERAEKEKSDWDRRVRERERERELAWREQAASRESKQAGHELEMDHEMDIVTQKTLATAASTGQQGLPDSTTSIDRDATTVAAAAAATTQQQARTTTEQPTSWTEHLDRPIDDVLKELRRPSSQQLRRS